MIIRDLSKTVLGSIVQFCEDHSFLEEDIRSMNNDGGWSTHINGKTLDVTLNETEIKKVEAMLEERKWMH